MKCLAKICFLSLFVALCCTPAISFAQEKASLVVLNAKITTLNPNQPEAEAIAVGNGRILAIGKSNNIRRYIGQSTRIIDAFQRRIIPGFNDSHVHFRAVGNQFSSINLSRSRSAKESIEAISRYVKFLPKGRWILGGSWNSQSWAPYESPDKTLLDEISPDNPVFLYNEDGTIALANSLALRKAKITATRNNPTGGIFYRFPDGQPTGLVQGNAIAYLRVAAPRLNTTDSYSVLLTASNYAASLGVTSIQDMSSDNNFLVLRRLENEEKLKTRVYDCTGLLDWKSQAARGVRRAQGTAFVRRGCLKGLLEGVGSEDELYQDIKGANRAGMQVMIHAIGGRAVSGTLNVFERIFKEEGKTDQRFRIEHARGVLIEDFSKFAEFGVIPSLQPELFGGREPYQTLLDSGAKIAFGSDASMVSLNPFYGIYDAVKQSGSDPISVENAIRLYSEGAAYAEFQESEKGTLTIGKLADFVILSDDILRIDLEDIKDTQVFMTIVNGEIVYRTD